MKKTAKLSSDQINYDKLNALNMQSKDLGDAYLSMQWDPLGPNFKLDIPYIEKYLQNARDKSQINTPDFINQGNKETKKAFKNALEHNAQIRTEIQNKFDLGEYALYNNVNIEEQVKDILFFLQCREQMIKIVLGQMKSKNFDTLQAYKNIYSLNKQLSSLLEETYRIEYNKKMAIINMLNLAEQQRKTQLEQQTGQQTEQQNSLQETKSKIKVGNAMLTLAQQALELITNLASSVTKNIDNAFSK